jgi:RNA polymerase sigma-70 factor (ECF subfamily)
MLIQLAYFQGFTQEEIAEETGLPLGTVKTRIRTALMVLRKDVNP